MTPTSVSALPDERVEMIARVIRELMRKKFEVWLSEVSCREAARDILAILPAPSAWQGMPTAWLVDGPLPLDSSEVFLVHEKALAAFNDWGKRITPLFAQSPPAPLPVATLTDEQMQQAATAARSASERVAIDARVDYAHKRIPVGPLPVAGERKDK